MAHYKEVANPGSAIGEAIGAAHGQNKSALVPRYALFCR